ncbi:hypothetical protein VTL71DRAFT_16163 [Oculimacula yallundae]|uniref:Uncharacterized protein n=1 Tax=Oculimacula yallundae TaxID=86028 RepID=A0ABR4CE91_9HELO
MSMTISKSPSGWSFDAVHVILAQVFYDLAEVEEEVVGLASIVAAGNLAIGTASAVPLPISPNTIFFATDIYFLYVDILDGQAINEIFSDLKNGVSDYDPNERHSIKGEKSKARDTAFKLWYLILQRDFVNEVRDSAKVFNAVLYLVSHAVTFKGGRE